MDLLKLNELSEEFPPKLNVENRRKNIFVTQLEEHREQNNEVNIKHIPVITECSSEILETGVNTLQTTLVLKKNIEVNEFHSKLLNKRQEFKACMQILEQKKADLHQKQLMTKQKAAKFEKFVEESEVKRRRALKKFLMEKQQNESKEKEITELTSHLEQLQARRLYLKEQLKKYKIFEEFLLKVLQLLPENNLNYGTDLFSPIIGRYETLSTSRQDLFQQLTSLTDELKTSQHNLDNLKQEHGTYKLMTDQKLTDLQTHLDEIKEKKKCLQLSLQTNVGQSRDQVEEMGNILLSVRNIGEQCYLNYYGPLEVMNIFTMMDMTKEFIVEKSDLEKRATRLADTNPVTPVKKTSTKTHLKSPSKIKSKIL